MTKRTIELLTPSVPNFIQTSVDKHMISVGDLTEDEITSLGELWTQALRDRAAEVSKQPPYMGIRGADK